MKSLASVSIFFSLLILMSSLAMGSKLMMSSTDTTGIAKLLRLSRKLIGQPGKKEKDIDSAIVLARKGLSMSGNGHFLRGEGESFLVLTLAFAEKKNDQQRTVCLENALAKFRKINYWPGLAEATRLKASFADQCDCVPVNRISLGKEALAYYMKTPNYVQTAECAIELADYYNMANLDRRESLRLLNLSLSLFAKAHDPRVQGVYSLMGLIYMQTGDFKEAVRNGLLAVSTGEKMRDSGSRMGTIYMRVAAVYNTMKDYGNAVIYGRKGITAARKNKDTAMVRLAVNNTAFALSNLHRYDQAIALLDETEKDYPSVSPTDRTYIYTRYINIYLDKGRPDLAGHYAKILTRMPKPTFKDEYYLIWYFSLSRYYLLNREYKKTLDFLDKFAPPLYGLIPNERLFIHQRKYKADSALGHFSAALGEHILLKDLSDSLFNEKKSRQISELNVQFETEGKNRKLLLQQQKLLLQKAELKRSQAVRSLFYYVTATLLVITALLVSRYRLKNRKNRELTGQKEIIDRKNDKLQQLLREKEWLLKEIHHRVKNNLQIIISLLNSQGAYAKDKAVVEAIQDSRSRVNSMAVIHQKLYKSPDMSSIDLPDYISDLVSYFRTSYVAGQRVDFRLDISPLIVNVSVAVPIALILNEAITNSLKYAFADGRDGMIRISLSVDSRGEVELLIADNGIGLPPGFDPEQQSSLGINIIRGLTEDIEGTYEIQSSKGTSISIRLSGGKLKEVFVTAD